LETGNRVRVRARGRVRLWERKASFDVRKRRSAPRWGAFKTQTMYVMAFVPEGQHDRSLARRARESPTPKEPSRRVRYDSDWRRRSAPGPDHTVPTGRFSRWTLSLALRARLRSCCPSGTKKILRGEVPSVKTSFPRVNPGLIRSAQATRAARFGRSLSLPSLRRAVACSGQASSFGLSFLISSPT
jgi:hypothetical protein